MFCKKILFCICFISNMLVSFGQEKCNSDITCRFSPNCIDGVRCVCDNHICKYTTQIKYLRIQNSNRKNYTN